MGELSSGERWLRDVGGLAEARKIARTYGVDLVSTLFVFAGPSGFHAKRARGKICGMLRARGVRSVDIYAWTGFTNDFYWAGARAKILETKAAARRRAGAPERPSRRVPLAAGQAGQAGQAGGVL